jgi:hypothetical protein
LKQKISYILILTGVSTLVAYSYVLSNDGFGKGDIQGFAFFSIILSAISLLLFNLYKRLFSKTNVTVGIILTIVFSILQTLVFVLLVWLLLGPWVGAYSFPIIWCWLSGIVIANFFVLIYSDNKFNVKFFVIGALTVGTFLLAIFLFNKGKDQLAYEQNFDIICLVYRPSEVLPKIEDLTKFSLTENEARAIIDLGLTGTFWTDKFFRISKSKLESTDFPNYDFDDLDNNPGAKNEFTFGNDLDTLTNSKTKVIIIMNHPQEEDFEFQEPLNTSMIVFQNVENDGFLQNRFSPETNSKFIKIKGTDFHGFPYSTPIIVNLKNRGDYRLHGFQWMEK